MYITFNQNNSGGYFIKNENVDEYVIIEGDNVDDIQKTAYSIFKNYREYCSCCGERWSDDWKDEEDLDEEPMIYDEPVHEYKGGYSYNAKAIIYHKNGEKEIVEI